MGKESPKILNQLVDIQSIYTRCCMECCYNYCPQVYSTILYIRKCLYKSGIWWLLFIRLMILSFWYCHLLKDFPFKIFLWVRFFVIFHFFLNWPSLSIFVSSKLWSLLSCISGTLCFKLRVYSCDQTIFTAHFELSYSLKKIYSWWWILFGRLCIQYIKSIHDYRKNISYN